MKHLVLIVMLMAGIWPASSPASRVPVPVLPLPTLTGADANACVEPLEVIRKEHMHLLMHQRDRTVHEAFREKRHSLNNCVTCHVQRDAAGKTIPVNAPGQFCQECHSYTAVKMDCFECHATTPDSGRRQ